MKGLKSPPQSKWRRVNAGFIVQMLPGLCCSAQNIFIDKPIRGGGFKKVVTHIGLFRAAQPNNLQVAINRDGLNYLIGNNDQTIAGELVISLFGKPLYRNMNPS